MGYVRDPATHNIGCYAPLLDIARVKTLIRRNGLVVRNKFVPRVKGASVKKTSFSPMSVSDFYIKAVHDIVCDVVPDEVDAEWAEEMMRRHVEQTGYSYEDFAKPTLEASSSVADSSDDIHSTTRFKRKKKTNTNGKLKG